MDSEAGMHNDDCDDAQSLALPVEEGASSAVIVDAAHAGHHDVSSSLSETTAASTLAFPLPTPAARLFTSRRLVSDASSVAGMRPLRWPSTSSPRTLGSSVVTFAPSTQYDQCRQRTNVALRRADDVSRLALPGPFLESPLSFMLAPEGLVADPALRALRLPHPRDIASRPSILSPQRAPSSTQSEDLRDVTVKDFNDTSSSADSACSTNSSSTTLLDSDTPAVRPRTPPSLALGLLLPNASLRAPSDGRHWTFPLVTGDMGSSVVAAVSATADASTPSLTDTSDVSFTLLEPEKLGSTATHWLAEAVGSVSERCYVEDSYTERVGVAPCQGCKGTLATHQTDEPCLTVAVVPSPLLLESFSLLSTPELTPFIVPPPSPPPTSVDLANLRVMLLAPDALSTEPYTAPLCDAFSSSNVELRVNAEAELTTLRQQKSSSAVIVEHSQWRGEEVNEALRTAGFPMDRAAAAISMARITEVYSNNCGTGAIDAQPARMTTPPHVTFLSVASSGNDSARDGCEGAVVNSCISSAGAGKVGAGGTAVPAPPSPHPPPHSAILFSPRPQGRSGGASAAAAGKAWLLSPIPRPIPSRPRLFQCPPECSAGLIKRSLEMILETERPPSLSDESPAVRDRGTPEGSSQPPARGDTAQQAHLWSRCEGPDVASVPMANSTTRGSLHHAGGIVSGEDDTTDATSPTKQLTHRRGSRGRRRSGHQSCDIGAGTPCLAKASKGSTAAGSLLPLTSPTPPRSLLAARYWSSFRLSGGQGSGHLLPCPQRHLPRQLATPFANVDTTATTGRAYPSLSSPVSQQSVGLDLSLLSLTVQSSSAPGRSTNLSLPCTPSLHAFPMPCKSPPNLTSTIATTTTRQRFSGREGLSSPASTTRSGPNPLSPLPYADPQGAVWCLDPNLARGGRDDS
ncbi:hypothetical protein MNV84_03603 [Leishmania braziliensis]|nr:hypothetical protein MNV84_03603 [Leishmania braziliensis]